ncbi:hypothetical protein [Kitasatospora sp. NPDC005856]|uniref:hypothetical protein n=1 Tax=Kitasatospora sp. NPDC005856 TaxID=3154566 RepID=UPI0033D71A46
MTSLFQHECEQTLREKWAKVCGDQPTEITVSTVPPLVAGPYTKDGLTCPHGITYWIEPTGEQIAQWARDGVA